MNEIKKREDSLFERISALIEEARRRVVTTVNIAEVYTKYSIGQYIVEDEQQGEIRAQYGKQVLQNLSARLTVRFGDGWSYPNLRKIRQFYLIYSNLINGVNQIESKNDKQCLSNSDSAPDVALLPKQKVITEPVFTLSWSHYLILMRIENADARRFYEIESTRQQWSVRQLGRQVGSSLYERLALSRNKDDVMRLAKEGQTIEKPSDVIKNPITLEFLGLKPDSVYTETKLENAIIGKMQQFLLELGKGFLFEARQKRFTFDEPASVLLGCICAKRECLQKRENQQSKLYTSILSASQTARWLLCRRHRENPGRQLAARDERGVAGVKNNANHKSKEGNPFYFWVALFAFISFILSWKTWLVKNMRPGHNNQASLS